MGNPTCRQSTPSPADSVQIGAGKGDANWTSEAPFWIDEVAHSEDAVLWDSAEGGTTKVRMLRAVEHRAALIARDPDAVRLV